MVALVGVAPGPPGNIQPEAKVIERGDDFVEVQVLEIRWRISLDEPMVPGEALVKTKLIGDSTRFPRHVTDAYRRTLRGIAPRLLYQRQNVAGSQLNVTDMANFDGKPILVITGEHDIDHPREVDGAIVDWLNENGAAAEFNFLVDNVVGGNGHMIMLEDNSGEVAAIIADWIETRL